MTSIDEAIKIMSNYGVFGCGYCHQGDDEVEETFDMAIKALKNSRWIPVSERLPKERERVLICVANPNNPNRVCISQRTDVNYWFGFGRDVEVLAWQPLPEPYEGEEE